MEILGLCPLTPTAWKEIVNTTYVSPTIISEQYLMSTESFSFASLRSNKGMLHHVLQKIGRKCWCTKLADFKCTHAKIGQPFLFLKLCIECEFVRYYSTHVYICVCMNFAQLQHVDRFIVFNLSEASQHTTTVTEIMS